MASVSIWWLEPATAASNWSRSRAKASPRLIDLSEARVVVAGGRGLEGPENFHLIDGLATAFNGAVGASRMVVDAGWKEHRYQVGQTGKVVTPSCMWPSASPAPFSTWWACRTPVAS